MYAEAQCSSWLFYSRDRDHYAEIARAVPLRPDFYNLNTMTAAVEILEAAGLIEHWKTAPSPQARHRSRFRATPDLLRSLELRRANLIFSSGPEIVLRDRNGQLLAIPNSRAISRMRRDIEAHNEFLDRIDIRLAHPDAEYDERGFLRFRNCRFDPRRRRYYRVFNRNFRRGGRWYGPFWQSLPKDVRTGLLINNEATIEEDFRACHLRLLSAMARLQLPLDHPTFDPFVGAGVERSAFKTAFNIMLNANTKSAARNAIAAEFSEQGWPSPHEFANAAMTAVANRFPSLADFWNSGIGLRLQNIDADICARVQRQFRNAGVPILSVHDSFIVPQKHRLDLTASMAIEMNGACQKLRNNATD
jgi:hypothetical protein